MKRVAPFLMLLGFGFGQEPPPPVLPPLNPAPAETAPKPEKPEKEEPEDLIETLINQSAKFYENKQRAKCGGALLEVAELIQDLAQPQPQRVEEEVEAFRALALMAARGDLNGHAVDFASARAYVRLSSIFCDRAAAKFESGKPRAAGQDWYRALIFTERSIDWGGYGLKDPGIDTLTQAKTSAQSLAEGSLVEADEVRTQLADSRNMISEIGRSLSSKAGTVWETTKGDGRRPVGVLEDRSREARDKSKRGLNRFGDVMRRWVP